MVLRVDVVAEALRAVRRPESLVLLCSPAGRALDQAWGQELSRAGHLILICGHYEGIDARIESLVDGLFSIGDYVLTGGELAALVLVDVAARLIPGVLGNPESPLRESFSEGLLEHPHYTRPQSWEGQEVPEVLRSGNHAAIDAWRRESSRQRTLKRRPDLLSEDQRGQDRSDS